jgi:hypothetical protein
MDAILACRERRVYTSFVRVRADRFRPPPRRGLESDPLKSAPLLSIRQAEMIRLRYIASFAVLFALLAAPAAQAKIDVLQTALRALDR